MFMLRVQFPDMLRGMKPVSWRRAGPGREGMGKWPARQAGLYFAGEGILFIVKWGGPGGAGQGRAAKAEQIARRVLGELDAAWNN